MKLNTSCNCELNLHLRTPVEIFPPPCPLTYTVLQQVFSREISDICQRSYSETKKSTVHFVLVYKVSLIEIQFMLQLDMRTGGGKLCVSTSPHPKWKRLQIRKTRAIIIFHYTVVCFDLSSEKMMSDCGTWQPRPCRGQFDCELIYATAVKLMEHTIRAWGGAQEAWPDQARSLPRVQSHF